MCVGISDIFPGEIANMGSLGTVLHLRPNSNGRHHITIQKYSVEYLHVIVAVSVSVMSVAKLLERRVLRVSGRMK